MPLCLFPQTQEKDSVSSDPKEIKQVVVTQAFSVEDLTEKVKQLTEYENELKGELYDCKKRINEQNITIEKLKHKLLFADSIVARLSNDCLLKKYDFKSGNSAIDNFDRMYSDNLKSKFSSLKTLLKKYGSYTQELKDIFMAVQNDKALENPFKGHEQALNYIDKIKATAYYKEAYNANWTIPYLNNIIDESFKRLKSFDPKVSKELHLIELME